MRTGYKAHRRERIFEAACVDCDGTAAPRPDCNICGLPIFAGDDWDISHAPVPRSFGGTAIGVAHRACNRLHGAQVVAPAAAKAKRQRRKHLGVTAPGRGPAPLPCGRLSRRKKTFRNGVVERPEPGERHRALMAALYGESS